MKLVLGLAVCTLLMGAVLWAQSDDFAEYQGWMKSNAATVADLNKNLTAKDGAAALKTVQANCAGCHMAHRDKAADGSFKIKTK